MDNLTDGEAGAGANYGGGLKIHRKTSLIIKQMTFTR